MKPQKLFYILLILWVFVDLLQAFFTPVHADEAYYALYGKFLDWGYYDHPPMVALLTAFSNLIFNGNLSIRFMTVLLHGATVWLIWKTLSDNTLTSCDVLIFFAIATSLVMFSIYGFMTTPDAPLLFFTALFFYLYKRYLNKPKWSTALGLGITISAMLYSKYMAVLVAGFVLLSNLKLLKDKRVWAAIVLAVALFVPHILWQIRNDFPSLQYHLIDRSEGFRIGNLLEFPLNQLLVFNPVCLCLAVFFCWKKRKTEDLFERACVFTIAGFILFFWIMTVKGHAEPHWTVAASVPMVVLLWDELRDLRWGKWLKWGILPVVCLLMVLRIAAPLIMNTKNVSWIGNHRYYEAIHQYCGQNPAVTVGSFQFPSLYQFYTGVTSMPFSSFYGRQTQFDLWQFDKDLQGKPVCFIADAYTRGGVPGFENVEIKGIPFLACKVEKLQSANRIQVTVNRYHVTKDSLYLDLTLKNPYNLDYDFAHPEFPTVLFVGYVEGDYRNTIMCPTPSDVIIPAGGSITISTAVNCIPTSPFVICIDNGICRSVNSKPIKIKAND